MKKIKILIGCLSFNELTGSELYVYELAKSLLKFDYDVSVVSPRMGGKLTKLANDCGIKVYNFNTLNKKENFDLIHCQHLPVTQELIKLFPNTKKICTIHSEVNSLENPVQHFSIFKYIAIRPEIKEHLIKNFKLPSEMIEVIYNPIDETRFNTNDARNDGYLLFVGTLDYLRMETIFDLIKYTKENNKEFWLVGKNHSNYLPQIMSNSHVKYFESTVDIEKFVKNCDITAGILLGRTTIEGWMCGKSGWIYNVNDKGQILGKELFSPPSDIDKFYVSNVVNKINDEYKKIINI